MPQPKSSTLRSSPPFLFRWIVSWCLELLRPDLRPEAREACVQDLWDLANDEFARCRSRLSVATWTIRELADMRNARDRVESWMEGSCDLQEAHILPFASPEERARARIYYAVGYIGLYASNAESNVAMIQLEAQRLGIPLQDVTGDASAERQQLEDILVRARAGKVDVIIVPSESHFCLPPEQLQTLKEMLKAYKVKILTLSTDTIRGFDPLPWVLLQQEAKLNVPE